MNGYAHAPLLLVTKPLRAFNVRQNHPELERTPFASANLWARNFAERYYVAFSFHMQAAIQAVSQKMCQDLRSSKPFRKRLRTTLAWLILCYRQCWHHLEESFPSSNHSRQRCTMFSNAGFNFTHLWPGLVSAAVASVSAPCKGALVRFVPCLLAIQEGSPLS